MSTIRWPIIAAFVILVPGQANVAEPRNAKLVKDINPGPDHSNPSSFTPVGDTLFFIANDGVSGRELWKSDGTEAGTVLFKDIDPGPILSNPGALAVFVDTLFFSAFDGVHGQEFWKTFPPKIAPPRKKTPTP